MSKVVSSVSLEPELKDWFQENYSEVSLSSIVEQVIREMRESGRRPDGVEFKRQMLEREIEQLEEQQTRAEQQLERFEELAEERGSHEEEVASAAEDFAERRTAHVDPENPGVQTQAAKVGVSPEVFAEEVNDRIDPGPKLSSTRAGGS